MNLDQRYIMAPIQMAFLQGDGKYFAPTTAFDIEPKGRWVRIQNACLWFLKKTGAIHPHFDERMLFKEMRLDRNRASAEIIRMALPQLQMLGHRAERIYIGVPEMRSLMSDTPKYGHPWEFEIQGATDMKIFNIPVTVIPWMEGVLVV